MLTEKTILSIYSGVASERLADSISCGPMTSIFSNAIDFLIDITKLLTKNNSLSRLIFSITVRTALSSLYGIVFAKIPWLVNSISMILSLWESFLGAKSTLHS